MKFYIDLRLRSFYWQSGIGCCCIFCTNLKGENQVKAKIIVLASVLVGLVSFSANGFAQDVGAAAKQQADLGMTVSPKVTELPEAARNALDAAGITDIAGMMVIDKKGTIHMLKSKEVTHRENVTFPIATTEIQGITSSSIVRYTGSDCITIIINGVPVTYCWP